MRKAAIWLLLLGLGLAPLRAQVKAKDKAPEHTAPLMEEDKKTARLIKQRVTELSGMDLQRLGQESLARERQYLSGLVAKFHMPETSALTLEAIRPMLRRLEAAQGRNPVSFARAVGNTFYEHDKVLAPGNPDIWTASGDNYAAQKLHGEAFRDYGQAIRLGRRDAHTWTGYGTAAFHMGDTRLAYRAAQNAVRLDPGDRAAVSLLKLSENRAPQARLPDVGDADEGLSAPASPAGAVPGASASVAPGLSPAEAAAAAQRQAGAPSSAAQQSAAVTAEAAAALGVKDYTRACDLAAKAAELNARNAQAWNYKAIAENKLGRFDAAVHDASFALGLEPGSAAALQTRSWAFSKTGRYREGLADANATLEVEPENSFAYYNRAFALAGLQDGEGVLDALRSAARLDRRFEAVYEQAVQAPQGADLAYLFDDVGARGVAPASGPAGGGRSRRFLRLLLLSLSGGALMGLGLLHVFSPRWRQRLGATLRRMTGAAPGAAGEPGEGFWSGYTVSREIGSGGMAVVYEAMDHALARRVAIKKMRDQIRADPQERRCFLDEARTVAALHHPNIVDIYSIVEDGGDIYLVFEYVDGKTLSSMLQSRGAFSFPAAREVLKQACAAVDYAHAQNVIHRDIKPSNIMIAADGKVKVMDFGVARRAKDALAKLSQTQHIVGTPPYMAPEQEQCLVRKESDVFSLGVCFYEMVGMKLPFAGQGAAMLLNKMNGRHEPLSLAVPGLPPGVDAVMAKALCPDPDRRYRTAGEFAAALSGLAG